MTKERSKMSTRPEEKSRKESLIEAAGRLFAEKGYEQATVREICELAGANVAAVNYYFGDKERLYRETLDAIVTSITNPPVEELLAGIDSPEERLRVCVRTMLASRFGPDKPEWGAKLFVQNMLYMNEAVRGQVTGHIRKVQGLVKGIVAELLGPAATPDNVKLGMLSTVSQVVFYFVMHAPHSPIPEENRVRMTPKNLDTVAGHIAEYALAGIRRMREVDYEPLD